MKDWKNTIKRLFRKTFTLEIEKIEQEEIKFDIIYCLWSGRDGRNSVNLNFTNGQLISIIPRRGDLTEALLKKVLKTYNKHKKKWCVENE